MQFPATTLKHCGSRWCNTTGVPKGAGVQSDDEVDDPADKVDAPDGEAAEPVHGSPSTPAAAGVEGKRHSSTGDAAPGSPPGAGTPRRQSDGRRWSWMEGGDAGQPADGGSSTDPVLHEDQVNIIVAHAQVVEWLV